MFGIAGAPLCAGGEGRVNLTRRGAGRECASIDDGVMTSASRIPGAGLGLYAERPFVRGEYVTLYEGELISRAEAEARPCRTHIAAREGVIVDGIKSPARGRGGGSFANGSRLEKEANASIVARLGLLYLRAKRRIEPGEEIIACYGRRGFELAMPRATGPATLACTPGRAAAVRRRPLSRASSGEAPPH